MTHMAVDLVPIVAAHNRNVCAVLNISPDWATDILFEIGPNNRSHRAAADLCWRCWQDGPPLTVAEALSNVEDQS
jgi:hypothetical protein